MDDHIYHKYIAFVSLVAKLHVQRLRNELTQVVNFTYASYEDWEMSVMVVMLLFFDTRWPQHLYCCANMKSQMEDNLTLQFVRMSTLLGHVTRP